MHLPKGLGFRKVLSKSVKQAGFTMIELLVVISVIGVLAVAVLSSINPIEQINKGRDTRTRSDAAQLINALERYFATHEYYAWNYTNPNNGYTPPADLDEEDEFDVEFEFDATGALGGTPDVADWDFAETLVDTAEVKQGFLSRLDDQDELYIYKGADSNATIYVCFEPESQAFKQEALDRCTAGEDPNTNDPDYNGVDPCAIAGSEMICLP